MNKIPLFLILLIYSYSSYSQTLIIELPQPESKEGSYMIGIYQEGDDFPNEPSIPKKVKVNNGFMRTFKSDDLKTGKYAVSVYHDLNENGKLDRNLVGIPKEPFAFSNTEKLKMGPPAFEDASFHLGSEVKTIAMEWIGGL